MVREIVEWCPHCDTENNFKWDITKDGYVSKCTGCGKPLMLCDECMNADDNTRNKCDWEKEGNICKCFRGQYKED